MGKKSKQQIRDSMKEPDYREIKKEMKISSDGKNLVSRIPKEIAKYLGIKAGHKIQYYIKIEKDKKPNLEIKIIKCQIKK